MSLSAHVIKFSFPCGNDKFIDRLEVVAKRSLRYKPQGRPFKEIKGSRSLYLLYLSNLIRATIARAACISDKLPRHLSFMSTVQLMRNIASLCITMTTNALRKLLPALLTTITQTVVGQQKRPNEPRVIKRRAKAYSSMQSPGFNLTRSRLKWVAQECLEYYNSILKFSAITELRNSEFC